MQTSRDRKKRMGISGKQENLERVDKEPGRQRKADLVYGSRHWLTDK